METISTQPCFHLLLPVNKSPGVRFALQWQFSPYDMYFLKHQHKAGVLSDLPDKELVLSLGRFVRHEWESLSRALKGVMETNRHGILVADDTGVKTLLGKDHYRPDNDAFRISLRSHNDSLVLGICIAQRPGEIHNPVCLAEISFSSIEEAIAAFKYPGEEEIIALEPVSR